MIATMSSVFDEGIKILNVVEGGDALRIAHYTRLNILYIMLLIIFGTIFITSLVIGTIVSTPYSTSSDSSIFAFLAIFSFIISMGIVIAYGFNTDKLDKEKEAPAEPHYFGIVDEDYSYNKFIEKFDIVNINGKIVEVKVK